MHQAQHVTPDTDHDRLRVAVWLLLGLVVAGGPLLALLNPSPDALLVVATALVLAFPIALRAVQGRFDPFEPIFIFVAAYGVMFVVRPAAMLIDDDMTFMVAQRWVDLADTFRPTLVLGLLGAIGFVLGDALRAGRRLAARIPAPPEPDMRRVVIAAVSLWLLGAFLYGAFLVQSGGLGLVLAGRSQALNDAYKQSSAYLYSAPFLMVAATLILYAVALGNRSRRLMWAALGSAALLCAVLGPTGSRTILFPLVLGMGVIHYTTRGRRPTAVSLIVVTLLALFVSAILLDLRSSTARQQLGVAAAIEHNVKDPMQMFAPLTHEADAAEMPALAAALTVVPNEVPHAWGTGTARDVLARPIPRQLWPDKPRQPKEQVIETLWPGLFELGVVNPEFSALLAFYIDGSYPGALIGMMLYGLLAAALYHWFRANATNIGARAIFAAGLPFIVSGARDTPVDTLMRVGFVAVPVLAVFYFVVSPERTARASSHLAERLGRRPRAERVPA
jgi:hypothetical protein